MSFFEATKLFEAAIEHTDADRNPAMWNLLAGLIKLSQALQHLDSEVGGVGRKVDGVSGDVKRIKNR